MAIEAVIFDCDGTLVDSEPLARAAWERTLAPYGYAIGDEEYPGLVGLPYARVHGYFAERIDGLPDAGAFWEDYSAALFALIDGELVRSRTRWRRWGSCGSGASPSRSRPPRRARGSTGRCGGRAWRTRSRSAWRATRSSTASPRRTCSSPRPTGWASRRRRAR